MSDNESEILNNFYDLLNKECEKQKITIQEFFEGGIDSSSSYQDKIQLPRFSQGLSKLGYEGDEISIIMNKFQNKFKKNYIDLEPIERNCELAKKKGVSQRNIFTENPEISLQNMLIKKTSNYEEKNKTNLDDKVENKNTFRALGPNAYIDLINEKIESETIRIRYEMENDKNYKLKDIYFKFYSKLNKGELYNIIQNNFFLKDKTLIGFISKREFSEILDEFLLLKNNDLEILFESLPKGKGDLYGYRFFLEKIKENNENELIKLRKEYNINYNNYIQLLRRIIKERNLDLRNMWVNAFGGELTCNKSDFYMLFKKNQIGNFHPLESEYIFSLISSDFKNLKFREFCDVINKNVEENQHLLLKDVNPNKDFYKVDIDNPNKKITTLIYKDNNNMDNKNKINEEKNNEILNDVNKNLENILNKKEDNNNIKKNEDNEINENSTSKRDNPNIKIKKHYNNIINISQRNKKTKTKFLNSSIRNPLYYDEMQYAENNKKREEIVLNRIKDSNENVENILDKHEKYIVLNLYKKYNEQFQNLGNEPLINFTIRDSNKTNQLKLNDFVSVLSALKCDSNIEKLQILLNSLNDKDYSLTFYSYKEFLNNVYNFKYIEEGKIDEIYYNAQINFNNYLQDFKKLI